MPNRSIHRNIIILQAIAQAAHAAPIQSTGQPNQGLDGITYAAVVSAVGGAGGTLTIEVSDTVGGTYVAADAGDVLYSRTNAESNTLVAGETTYASYVGIRAFTRVVVTPVTSATGFVVVVRNHLSLVPVNPTLA